MEKISIQYKFVSIYIIGSDGDRTVGAPYCRGTPSITYKYNPEYNSEDHLEKLASLNKAQLDLRETFDKISSFSEFISKYNDLQQVLEAQMYGRESNQDLISKLSILKNNILSTSLTDQQKDDFNSKYQYLDKMCSGGLRYGDIGKAH